MLHPTPLPPLSHLQQSPANQLNLTNEEIVTAILDLSPNKAAGLDQLQDAHLRLNVENPQLNTPHCYSPNNFQNN
jgi:hypothetical protein